MSGLSDLLQRLNTEGWSSRRIERETEKHGRKVSYASVSRYLNGTHPKNPDAGTLQALADAFGVHVNELREALGRPGVREPFDLGEDGARLTGPQREAIRRTVQLFVEQNDVLAGRPQPDGATTRPSAPPLRLLSDDVPDLEGLPYAADEDRPGDDPGEDDD